MGWWQGKGKPGVGWPWSLLCRSERGHQAWFQVSDVGQPGDANSDWYVVRGICPCQPGSGEGSQTRAMCCGGYKPLKVLAASPTALGRQWVMEACCFWGSGSSVRGHVGGRGTL